MARLGWRHLGGFWIVPLILGTGTGRAPADEIVRLTGWDEPATLARHKGPGGEFYQLSAGTKWQRGATGQFFARIEGPDCQQVETRPVAPGERRINVLVLASSVRNRLPEAVTVRLTVIEQTTGAAASNVLTAGIDDFPHPRPEGSAIDPGPFGWGHPLEGPAGQARPLPNDGPDGWQFVRIPASPTAPGFFLATTEATIRQVRSGLPGYDPHKRPSDEYQLEGSNQPALGLTPNQAQAYLAGPGQSDPSGLTYRLPTRAEWLRAARAGRASAFWWGDEPSYPAGANFHGDEPALKGETTAPSRPSETRPDFAANAWGLYHTFGNVAEWAVDPAGGFVRLGGSFRTETNAPPPEVPVADPDALGVPDAYVGVRPAFSADAESGAAVVRKALQADPRLANVTVAFDPDRATATLSGTLPEASLRRVADTRLNPLWFLAAVENQIESPSFAPGQLATLGAVSGPVRRITPLGRWFYEVPVSVRWADPLPVSGSEWWVNIYLCNGRHYSHRLAEQRPDQAAQRLIVLIDRAQLTGAGLAVDAPVKVGLSLGAEAPTTSDPHLVSNLALVEWRLP